MTEEAVHLTGALHAGFSSPIEAIATCSAALRRIKEAKPELNSIGVTSARQLEGRTTIATAVAVAESEYAGRRTVLLDCDGAAVQAEAACVPPSTAGELLDSVSWMSQSLGVLGAPTLVPLVREANGPSVIGDLISDLRMQGVFVVADLPPLALGTPTHTLIPLFDAVIQVVLAGSTPVDAVREAGDLLPEQPFIILNKISTSIPRWLGGTRTDRCGS